MSIHWHSYASAEKAAEACCRHILPRLEEAMAGQRVATLAVSGGSTPRLLFEQFARSGFNWQRVHLFWADERAVPPIDPESNYLLAEECFFKPGRFPLRNVHRVHGELRPDVAAEEYVHEIEDFFALKRGELPHFDLIHLGMGGDAHTASLFPGEPLIQDRERIAAAVFVEKLGKWRVTLLPGVLMAARHIVLLVAGEDKAEAIRLVFDDPYDPVKFPAQFVTHHCRHVTWFVDTAAAALTSV
ncbi:MAG: 6-phosphogluconolactonase [Acidobacteria bacterium]|nr:6-phosphogluconolactonase [Acidobacteriota bacterium]